MLRVSPSGSKAWAFVYRVEGKPPQWLTLGSYPALTLVDARKLALDGRRDVRVNRKDPAAERRAARAAAAEPRPAVAPVFTFADLAKLYQTFAKGTKKTWRDDMRKVDKYLLPAWGPLTLREITRTHVHELLDRLAADGLTIGVNRVQALISRMFTVALDRELVNAHPAARMIKRFEEQPAERVLSNAELRALWSGLDAQPGDAADAVRLRLLLGQRGEEIASMAWSEVDLEGRVWEIPGRRTKNSRPHAVPLPATAHALLERRAAEKGSEDARVFPDLTLQSGGHRALAAIHRGAYEWKDLRRTVATRLAAVGFDETTIGRVLNHARHTVTGRHYNQHGYFTEKQRALEAWDRELQRILRDEPKARTVVAQFRS